MLISIIHMPIFSILFFPLFLTLHLFSLTVLPLHSSISGEEQYKVFLKPEKGKRKVFILFKRVQAILLGLTLQDGGGFVYGWGVAQFL